jgi:hypothetical protein
MKGRFQPTTVGNMVRCKDGSYVCQADYEELAALLRECRLAMDDLLRQKPMMTGLQCGTTTLGNLRAMLFEFKDESSCLGLTNTK